jgi:hypothetical protein
VSTEEERPRSAKERAALLKARTELERDRLLESLLRTPPDPRTKPGKKKAKKRGRRGRPRLERPARARPPETAPGEGGAS